MTGFTCCSRIIWTYTNIDDDRSALGNVVENFSGMTSIFVKKMSNLLNLIDIISYRGVYFHILFHYYGFLSNDNL